MKTKARESVLMEWVEELPFMQQALLCLSMRGPDGINKYSSAKIILKYMRSTVLKPAGEYEANNDGFMWKNWDLFPEYVDSFFSDTDKYPMHFLMHLIHAAEVIAYKHPDQFMRSTWFSFYRMACKRLHMNPETEKQLDERLNL